MAISVSHERVPIARTTEFEHDRRHPNWKQGPRLVILDPGRLLWCRRRCRSISGLNFATIEERALREHVLSRLVRPQSRVSSRPLVMARMPAAPMRSRKSRHAVADIGRGDAGADRRCTGQAEKPADSPKKSPPLQPAALRDRRLLADAAFQLRLQRPCRSNLPTRLARPEPFLAAAEGFRMRG